MPIEMTPHEASMLLWSMACVAVYALCLALVMYIANRRASEGPDEIYYYAKFCAEQCTDRGSLKCLSCNPLLMEIEQRRTNETDLEVRPQPRKLSGFGNAQRR